MYNEVVVEEGGDEVFYYIRSLLSDPRATLLVIVLALPGRMLAMSMHEYAHAYVANRCGDPTAKYLGRLTLNPLKHIDILGFIMLYVVGFGWAKPVPVNPRNFKRNYRKCDLAVSLAGIAVNALMFVLGGFVLYAVMGVALGTLDQTGATHAFNGAGAYLTQIDGVQSVVVGGYYASVRDLMTYAPYMGEFLIRPLWGDLAYYLFEILSYFVQINIVLAIFNLIPVPPLDGYHVLNDLVLKRDLFASPRAGQIGYVLMLVLLFSGVLSEALGFVIDKAFFLTGSAAGALYSLVGVI